mgnify:CR=1 FL=1
MDVENNIAGEVADSGIRMGGAVVDKLSDGLGSGVSTIGLGRSKIAEGDEHPGINGTSIVVE